MECGESWSACRVSLWGGWRARPDYYRLRGRGRAELPLQKGHYLSRRSYSMRVRYNRVNGRRGSEDVNKEDCGE